MSSREYLIRLIIQVCSNPFKYSVNYNPNSVPSTKLVQSLPVSGPWTDCNVTPWRNTNAQPTIEGPSFILPMLFLF